MPLSLLSASQTGGRPLSGAPMLNWHTLYLGSWQTWLPPCMIHGGWKVLTAPHCGNCWKLEAVLGQLLCEVHPPLSVAHMAFGALQQGRGVL